MTNSWCYKVGRTIVVKRLMLHSTATPGVMALDWFTRWNTPTTAKAVHAFIDDKTIVQYYPWTWRCWHAGVAYSGGISANNDTIGVEMCEDREHGEAYFYTTIENAAQLFAHLCVLFNLDPKKDIISHREGYVIYKVASNHGDPEAWFTKYGYTMDKFRQRVYDIMNPVVIPEPVVVKPVTVMYRVIIDGKQIMALGSLDNAKAKVQELTPVGKKGMVQRNTDGAILFTFTNVEKPIATWELHITGQVVKDLQTDVNKFFGKTVVTVDGYYGDETKDNVPNDIHFGMKLPIVGEIQKRLKTLGFYKLNIDNKFGDGTKKAVIAFQKSKGLDDDGVVGRNTFDYLYRK